MAGEDQDVVCEEIVIDNIGDGAGIKAIGFFKNQFGSFGNNMRISEFINGAV